MRAGVLVMFLVGMLYKDKKIPFSDITVITSRNINITPEFSIYVINVKAKNKGNAISYFIHPISKEERQHLSYITAFEENGGIQLQVLQLEDSAGRHSGYVYYKIDFFSPLKKDSTLEFQIQYVLSEYWKVYPMQNNRNQSQIVLWEGSPNYVSVYPIENDNSIVTIENAKILSYTGTKLNGNKIQYGPTESIAPFTSNNVSIQYEILPYKSQPTSVNKILTNIKAYKIETFLEGNILLIIILMAILVFICYLFFTRLLKKLRKPYVPAKKVV